MFELEKKHKEEFEKRVESIKQNLKAALDAEMLQAAELEGADPFEASRKG